MKKYLALIFFTFFFFNTSNASYEGYGPLKLSPTVVEYFNKYLDAKRIFNESKGSERHGRGWFFFVEENGEEFGFSYCPQGKQCVRTPAVARKACKKNVKKYLKKKSKCKLFAKQRNIVWDGKNLKIPLNATVDEVETILRNNNFID
ncbi:hypothetical protein N9D74_00910 [Candidatus Pelagibacter sp.]|nr:hypothetical protein [Candidatus Pelagibacter sp.]